MRFDCTIKRRLDGRWLIRQMGSEVGEVETTDNSREAAVEKMRGELRYRLETRAKRPPDGCPDLV
jgi:hypothetical protein